MIRIADTEPRSIFASLAARSTRKRPYKRRRIATSTRPWAAGWMTSRSATRVMPTCIATPATGQSRPLAGTCKASSQKPSRRSYPCQQRVRSRLLILDG